MLKSMTAYGRAYIVTPMGRFIAELHSVNRKHLEINTNLPNELLRYDASIKKWIAAEVGRGQVNVKISVSFEHSSPLVVSPNLPLVKQMKLAWEAIAEELKTPFENDAFLKILSNRTDLFFFEEDLQNEELYEQALQKVISNALTQFIAMKLSEGKELYQDISSRFLKLVPLIKEISIKSPGATERYRQKLIERLKELVGATEEMDERILREVGIYAERIDIMEELTRFDSHLKQAGELLTTSGQGIGKTMEFLVQELNREINTIGSKSSDVAVSRLVIEIKSELERIREQIQNIE